MRLPLSGDSIHIKMSHKGNFKSIGVEHDFRTDVDIGGPSYVRLARLDVQNPATRDTTQEPEGRDRLFIQWRNFHLMS